MLMVIIVGIFLLIISSFFSSYETAFYSVEAKNHNTKSKKIFYMLNVILMGNATVRVLFSEITSYNLENLLLGYGFPSSVIQHLVVIAITSVILIVLGESLPLNFGIAYPQLVYKNLKWFIKGASVIFWPVVKPLTIVVHSMISFLERRYKTNNNLTAEEIRSIIQISYEREIVNPNEKQLTDAIINLYSQPVGSYMIPRRDIPFVDMEDPIFTVWENMQQYQYSKLVITEGDSIDHIIGYFSIEEIVNIPDIKTNQTAIKYFKDKIRQHTIIPESKKVVEAIKILQSENRNLGIVIDEYGGLDGLVTINDLLKSILVGDEHSHFRKNHQSDNSSEIETVKGGIMVNALRTTLRSVLEYFDQYEEELPELDWNISRLILKKLDRFPEEGEEIKIQDFYFKVISMQNRSIYQVFIGLISQNK